MSRQRWLQTLLQGTVIAISMAAGAVLAVSVAGGEPGPAPAIQADPTAESLPVSNVAAAPEATAAAGPAPGAVVDASLPDLIEQARQSVVAVFSANIGMAASPFGEREFRSEGEGTGIVVDREGHILTNFHVVDGASEVRVEFADGTVALAQVVGFDPDNDLAVLRASVQPQRLYPATFGDSDRVRVGETVLAIGNPFAFDFSVTRGIVSGVARESSQNSSGRAIRGVIQIDAAVNPGNSGGPLFNTKGEVIGVNTAIHNPTQQRVFVGIGLAVPSNTALRYLPDMIAGRTIEHPQLGIAGQTLNAVNALHAGLDVDRGVYITSVAPGTAAARAGLRAPSTSDGAGLAPGGDIVTHIDGVEVRSIQELAWLIDLRDVGDEITLRVIRAGAPLEIVVTLQAWQG